MLRPIGLCHRPTIMVIHIAFKYINLPVPNTDISVLAEINIIIILHPSRLSGGAEH